MRLPRHRVELICAIIPTRRFQMESIGAEDEGQASLTRDLDWGLPELSRQYKGITRSLFPGLIALLLYIQPL